jgi:hypothetical protein
MSLQQNEILRLFQLFWMLKACPAPRRCRAARVSLRREAREKPGNSKDFHRFAQTVW